MTLTKNEIQIMDVLWAANEPLSRSQIIEKAGDKNWQNASIHTILNNLMKKEAVCSSGAIKCGKTRGRLYRANISVEEYYASNLGVAKTQPNPAKLFDAISEELELDGRTIRAYMADLIDRERAEEENRA